MTHTPEPWHAILGDDYAERPNRFSVWDFSGAEIALIVGEPGRYKANAERIVACVNACKNVSNADLEDVAAGRRWMIVTAEGAEQVPA